MNISIKSDRTLAWTRVITLAVAAFVFNTTEFAPIALLSNIADSFHMTTAKTGLMITIYAWVVAAASLPLMLLTSKIERRKLLTAVFALFIIGHLISSIAWDFNILILGRVCIAFSHAIFWSITASLAIRLAPPGKKAQALGLLSTGTALATVLGLPVGRIVGQCLGWRWTFFIIGLIACLIMLILRRTFPLLPSIRTGSLQSLPKLLRCRPLVGLFILTIIVITAHFTTYSYIEPFVLTIGTQHANFTTLLLLVFGVAGVIGSFIFANFHNRFPIAFLPLAISILIICLALLTNIVHYPLLLITVALCWGIAIMCISLAMQIKVIDLAPEATDLAMSIYSGIFNIGIGGGALLGSTIITHFGMKNIGYSGSSIALIAFLGCLLLLYYYRIAFVHQSSKDSI